MCCLMAFMNTPSDRKWSRLRHWEPYALGAITDRLSSSVKLDFFLSLLNFRTEKSFKLELKMQQRLGKSTPHRVVSLIAYTHCPRARTLFFIRHGKVKKYLRTQHKLPRIASLLERTNRDLSYRFFEALPESLLNKFLGHDFTYHITIYYALAHTYEPPRLKVKKCVILMRCAMSGALSVSFVSLHAQTGNKSLIHTWFHIFCAPHCAE